MKVLGSIKNHICSTSAIIGKELKSYFVSPIAYSVLTVFTIISGVYFYIVITNFYTRFKQYQMYQQIYKQQDLISRINLNELVVAPLFQFLIIIMIFVIPAVTMRLIADEKKSYTDELLLTSPISSYDIILGKYIGAFLFLVIMLSTTAIYIGVLLFFGSPEIGPILTGYLGLVLVGATLLAIGLFASSLTSNQINAYFISFAVGLLLLITGWAGQLAGGKLGQVLSFLSISDHYKDLARGLIISTDIIYYLTFILCFVFLAKSVLESKKWR